MFGLECRVTKSLSRYERRAVESLLGRSGLVFEGTPDYIALAEDTEGRLAATASLTGSVIKMVAADSQWQEAGLSGVVISALMRTAGEKGLYHLFIYTKPEMADRFAGLGFRPLAAAPSAVLMESGAPGIAQYKEKLAAERIKAEKDGAAPAAAAVMNCNPFTLGHLHLIEEAARGAARLYVIVVEEDASVFPFADRISLVQRGTAHLPNVCVIGSGSYAVSAATFPTYFLKDRAEPAAAKVQAELDASLFGLLFVKELGITRRFVGTEPFCPVTAVYNEALKASLPSFGCAVTEIERIQADGAAISASRVRAMLAGGTEPEVLSALLPSVTIDYLKSAKGAEIIKKLREKK